MSPFTEHLVHGVARSVVGSSLVLASIAGAVLFFRLGALPFLGADEPRYARVAEEMQHAGSWVTPLLEGRPWLEKPPLYYWMTIPLLGAFGVGETTARLAPALAALAAALILMLCGRRLFGPQAGLYGGAILLTSFGFVAFGRSASTDMPFTAALTAALALVGTAVFDASAPRWWVQAGWACLGLAILAKGPAALPLAAVAALLFWWIDGAEGMSRRIRPLSGLALAAAVALPWFYLAFRENGFAFISVFLIHHHLARYVSDLHHHSEPFYYYVPVAAGLLFPWTGWMALLFVRPARRDPRALWLVCWALAPIVFYSLSSSKLPGYILPSLPPAALLLGRAIAELDSEARTSAAVLWPPLAVSAAVALAVPYFLSARYGIAWGAGAVVGGSILVPAVAAFFWARKEHLRRAAVTTMAGAVVTIIAVTQIAFPALAERHSTRQIARQALDQAGTGTPIVPYRFFHHSLRYYTGYRIEPQLADREALERFALAHPRFLVVTPDDSARDLRHLGGFEVATLARQGRLELLRVAHR